MKYLAILRDSIREAIDSKILYAALAVSALLVLLTASISFRPVSAEEQVNGFAVRMNWLMGRFLRDRAPHYGFEDFAETNVEAPPWERDYRFAFVLGLADAKEVEQVKKERA